MARHTEPRGLSPTVPAAEAGRRWVEARLSDARREEAFLLEGPLVDPVHDTRVALRRLRSALHVFGRGKLRKLQKDVKALQDALGEVRDLHVQREWLRAEQKRGGAPVRELLARVGKQLPQREAELVDALRTFREQTAPVLVAELESVRRRGKLAGRRVRERWGERLDQLEQRLGPARTLEARAAHALRITLKKLRYETELLRPAFPGPLGALLDQLEPLQEALGALHDADVHLELVRSLDATPEQQALLKRLAADREKQAKTLSAALAKLDTDRVLQRTREALTLV